MFAVGQSGEREDFTLWAVGTTQDRAWPESWTSAVLSRLPKCREPDDQTRGSA